MFKSGVRELLVLFTLTVAGCSTQDPAADTSRRQDKAARPMQDDVSTNTGSRMDSDPSAPARGSTPSRGESKEADRGNTPPGKDRAGQGPASGAIVDPAGATKKGNAY